jgi:hypothetical protein
VIVVAPVLVMVVPASTAKLLAVPRLTDVAAKAVPARTAARKTAKPIVPMRFISLLFRSLPAFELGRRCDDVGHRPASRSRPGHRGVVAMSQASASSWHGDATVHTVRRSDVSPRTPPVITTVHLLYLSAINPSSAWAIDVTDCGNSTR